jgi:YbbR domain-containing protein
MLKSNTLNKIIAVAVALTLWAYVITSENTTYNTIIRGIPVQFANQEALAAFNLTVASDESYSVDITVEGRRVDTATLTAEDFTASVDLAGRRHGEQSFLINVTGPGNVNILEKRPVRLTLTVEDMVSVSKPVRIEYTEPFPEDKEPGFISMFPESIEVTGAKSQVDDVEYISALLDSNELEGAQRSFIVAAELVNRDGSPVEAPLRLSHANIEVRAMLCDIREAPLSVDIIGETSANLEVTEMQIPNHVYIRGSSLALSQVETLTAAPIDISKVDVTSRIPLAISLPAGVELAEASKDVSVSVTIKGIETKEFLFASNEVVMEGLAEGYRAYVTDGDITVSVSGTESVMADLKKEDITPYVDMTEIDPFVIGPELPLAPQPVLLRYEKALRRAEALPALVNLNIVQTPPAEIPAPEELSEPDESLSDGSDTDNPNDGVDGADGGEGGAGDSTPSRG